MYICVQYMYMYIPASLSFLFYRCMYSMHLYMHVQHVYRLFVI